ncbi:unnamed protein product [Laminaria digitata]
MQKKREHYDNGTEFNFISNSREYLDKTPTQLKKLVFEVVEVKPYVLDWEDITCKYHHYLDVYKWINIEEFAFKYVLGYSLLNEFAKDNLKKEAMYLHLRWELMT